MLTITHPWCDGHSTSISACSTHHKHLYLWRVRTGIQVFRNELHIHIHLDYVRVEFLSYLKKKKKKCLKFLTLGLCLICLFCCQSRSIQMMCDMLYGLKFQVGWGACCLWQGHSRHGHCVCN